MWLFTETNGTVGDRITNSQPNTAANLPDNGSAMRSTSDSGFEVATTNGPSGHNRPDAVPSTSAETAKTGKDEKAKDEAMKVVGMFELVWMGLYYL